MFKKLFSSGLAMMAAASANLFGVKRAEVESIPVPVMQHFTTHSARRHHTVRRPAGSKLARMASEGRVTLRHGEGARA